MLKVRNAQLHALEDHGRREFRDIVVELLERRHPAAFRDVPAAYAERLLSTAFDICRRNGFAQQGDLIDFADALMANESHPMDAPRIEAKGLDVLRMLRSREAFSRLRAQAARAGGGASGAQADDAADPIQE